jgi:serine/threonine-protein kinase
VQLGRIVAVKFLHSAFAASAEFKARFELEARTMSRLDHPHCVSVIDFGIADAPFIVMDHVTGTTLKALIEQGPVPPARALAIARQVLAGLAHAHEKGIIHRDVKPANIMLAQATATGDHVKILDFGLAKLVDAEQSASSMVVGTPSYMSPEQAAARKVDGRTDIYATAVVLFELLTGEKPFVSDQALDLVRMHIEAPPPSLRSLLPEGGFSDALEAVLQRGLAKSPDDRFQTPGEMADALAATPEAASARTATARPGGTASDVVSVDRTRGPRPASAAAIGHEPTVAAPPRDVRRRSGGTWLVALAVAVLLGGGLYAWNRLGRPGSRRPPPTAAAPAAPPTLAGAKALIERGDREGALRILHDLRRERPKDADIVFLIGNLYVDKGWRAEALAAYREAIEDNGAYRKNATLQRNAIDALDDPQAGDKARALLANKIGAAALPALRTASRSGRTAEIRRLAGQLAKELARPGER